MPSHEATPTVGGTVNRLLSACSSVLLNLGVCVCQVYINIKFFEIVKEAGTGCPCYIIYKYGAGRILAMMVTPEWMGRCANPGANAMYTLYDDLYTACMWAGGQKSGF
ncbi:MAG: hypothetical protein AOA66_1047 [Candidatus Bathyarchaeota archaeon BA2]|nr:MAG: hypothetical protein AOA66_1047 [Candidatus Bathyarchaeota archaeon BA2]